MLFHFPDVMEYYNNVSLPASSILCTKIHKDYMLYIYIYIYDIYNTCWVKMIFRYVLGVWVHYSYFCTCYTSRLQNFDNNTICYVIKFSLVVLWRNPPIMAEESNRVFWYISIYMRQCIYIYMQWCHNISTKICIVHCVFKYRWSQIWFIQEVTVTEWVVQYRNDYINDVYP